MRLFRLIKIFHVLYRFGLEDVFLAHPRVRWLRAPVRRALFWRPITSARAIRLRLALEALGPIFVKFGQMLSTRRDILPLDVADELARLQDQVPPFAPEVVMATLERNYGVPASQVFAAFDPVPVASASIAQVHFAVLPDGREVAVKVLRPNLARIIGRDLALMDVAAGLVERFWADGRRLRPREVVAEFAKHLRDELDLVREAGNASQLRRNFAGSPLLKVPEIYWDETTAEVMVMERINGTPISQVGSLRRQGVDIPRLAETGVEIFFTQVFRDSFFHADMHPGNIFVSPEGQYIAVDFGIMGTLTEADKHYLAQNFLAFFQRDYRRVALAHVEAGWAPRDTRVDEFESAIRAVCEPVFDRPLKEISFGKVLLRLFQTSRRFNVQIQPQLVLLQKTMLNIEGLGRQLDPDLDLWKTAKPFLERWMSEQLGVRGFLTTIRQEAPYWGILLPQMPRLMHRALSRELAVAPDLLMAEFVRRHRQQNRWIKAGVILLVLLLGWQVALTFA